MIASLLAVAVIVGIACGTVFFPRTLTLTTTQTATQTTILPTSQRTSLVSIKTVGNETFVTWNTTLNTCASCTSHGGGATFTFPLSVNYSGGPWSLHYWVQNFTGIQNSISGSLYGSGNSSIWITFYVAGYAEYTLCASATKLPNDSQQQYDLPLTLSSLGQYATAANSTSTVETCGTMAV